MKALALSMAMSSLLAVSAFADPPATAPASAPVNWPAAEIAAILRRPVPPGGLGGPVDVLVNGQLEVQRRNARTQQQIYASHPLAGTFRLEEVVQFTLTDGFLRADFGPSEFPPGQMVFKVDGLGSTWTARSNANVGLRAGRYVNLNRYDFDQLEEGQIWHASLNCSDAYLNLNAVGIGFTVNYQQVNGIVAFSVMRLENGRNRPLFYFSAPNLPRLQADHPEEVRQFLVPLFGRWSIQELLAPGATEVYSVFAELAPPAAAVGEVAAIVPRLDSESFPERDAASRDLARLGRAGVQAALRLDRGALSYEQNGRIDAFLDHHRRRWIEDPRAMRGQISFLLDCLEDEDAAVRAAAKGALEKAAGRPVRFDPASDAVARASAVEALRQTLPPRRDGSPAMQPN